MRCASARRRHICDQVQRYPSPPTAEPLEHRVLLAAFFVSPSGADSAPGTAEQPWRTLQHAADTVEPGDVVTARAGNYSAGFFLSTSGTEAAPILFSAEPGAVIAGRNPVTADGINLEGADYITIEGFTIVGSGRAGIRSVVNRNVTIRNNTCDQNATWGILTGFSEDVVIEGNVASRSAGQHGIYVSNSADRPVVRGNTSWGNRQAGIHMNGDIDVGEGDGIITGALIENNTIYGNGAGGASGINCDGVQDSRIQNNLLYDNHASGISLYRINGGGGSNNNIVVNNTVVMAADGRWTLNIQDGSTGNVAFNNVLYHAGTRGSINIAADCLPGFVSDYNAVTNRFTPDAEGTIMTLAEWQSATGQDRHSFVATPADLFVAPSTGDYRLKASSPAVNAGAGAVAGQAAPSRDLTGSARPSGGAFDVGAYEWQGAVSPQVLQRYVFYNNSAFDGHSAAADTRDDAAIATEKQPLLPGQTAAFQNSTSYSRGLNGIMIDIAGLPAGAVLSVDDFEFRTDEGTFGPDWAVAPSPSVIAVRRGEGVGGSDRVTLVWPDYGSGLPGQAVANAFLRVTIRATPDTGLTGPDVFSFGNLVGNTDADWVVDAMDVMNLRRELGRPPQPSQRAYDMDQDGMLTIHDLVLVRASYGRSIAPPPSNPSVTGALPAPQEWSRASARRRAAYMLSTYIPSGAGQLCRPRSGR